MGNVKVFVHRVDHDDLILRAEEHIPHFHFAKERFSGARHAEDKAVSVDQLLAVSDVDVF